MKKYFLLLAIIIFCGFKANDPKPRVFLIGDSTCANKNAIDFPETGWGMVLGEYFTDAVEIQNHAVNGRSSKSFRTEGRWKVINDQLRAGDYVVIQFGHNDQKTTDSTRYAAPQTDYRANLTRYVNETKAKGAFPILATPVMRRKFDENGKFVDQHGEYPQVMKEVAKATNTPLIDMHARSQKVIEEHGVDGSKKMFLHYGGGLFKKFPKGIEDNTHFSGYGARLMASLFVDELFATGNPLRNFAKTSSFTGKYAYELPKIYQPYFRKDTFNVVRYGAKPDGITLNSKAINQAVDMANQAGGGTVLIPKGLWLTGPISLKNNVNLHLEKGAVVQFSDQYSEYPLVKTNWEGVDAYRCQSPISGFDLENIAITGQGVFDGAGHVWRAVKKSKMTDGEWKGLVASGGLLNDKKDMWYPTEKSYKGATANKGGIIANGWTLQSCEDIKDFLRPNMISLQRCKNVMIDGPLFQNSPAWTIHPLLCEHLTVQNVMVKNPWYGQNNDAIDVESCRNFLLDNNTFDTGDDGICIKSGRDEEGRKRGVPTANGIIKNTTVFRGHGGFVIGSEMSGGVNNLYVSDCNFLGTDVGLRFKTARGRGGVVEKIYVNNISMINIVGEAVIFDMYYMAKDPVPQLGESNELPAMEAQPLGEGTPQFRDFHVENIACKGAETAILVRGLPEMSVKDISIENAYIQSNKGLVCVEGENISLKNVTLLTKDETVMQVQNSKNVVLDKITYADNKAVLLKMSGKRNKDVKVVNTDMKKAKKAIEK